MPTQDDIQGQITRLALYRKTLQGLLNQVALLTFAQSSPAQMNGIHEARTSIRQIKGILQDWGYEVEDHPDDEEVQTEQHRLPSVATTSPKPPRPYPVPGRIVRPRKGAVRRSKGYNAANSEQMFGTMGGMIPPRNLPTPLSLNLPDPPSQTLDVFISNPAVQQLERFLRMDRAAWSHIGHPIPHESDFHTATYLDAKKRHLDHCIQRVTSIEDVFRSGRFQRELILEELRVVVIATGEQLGDLTRFQPLVEGDPLSLTFASAVARAKDSATEIRSVVMRGADNEQVKIKLRALALAVQYLVRQIEYLNQSLVQGLSKSSTSDNDILINIDVTLLQKKMPN